MLRYLCPKIKTKIRKSGDFIMLQNVFEQKNTLSFEIFPPKKDGEFESAFRVLDSLGNLKPDFISVTYGAGGSRSGKTIEDQCHGPHNLRGQQKGGHPPGFGSFTGT